MSMSVFGIPQERVVLGIVCLVAFGVFYDNFIVDWLETHKPYVPAQTAVEVIVGVFVVLSIYLLSVRDIEISGIDSFMLLLVYFASAGLPMVFGSDGRVTPYCDSAIRKL
jgi:quinol-cytochrome oxidoreductase complex cytochrome b subunit